MENQKQSRLYIIYSKNNYQKIGNITFTSSKKTKEIREKDATNYLMKEKKYSNFIVKEYSKPIKDKLQTLKVTQNELSILAYGLHNTLKEFVMMNDNFKMNDLGDKIKEIRSLLSQLNSKFDR